MNLNKVVLIGRLAADPEGRTTQSGQNVASIRVVTNRVWNNPSGQKQEQAEFHSVTLWGRLAQIATQYLVKGGLVMVEGRLQTRSWVGQDNVKKYRTEIVAENIQLGPKSASAGFKTNSNFQSNYGSSQKFTSQDAPAPSASSNQREPVDTVTSQETEEEIPIINEDEPIISDDEVEVEKAEVDLKDIPF